MKTINVKQLNKWGNSYGLRITKAEIEEMGATPQTNFEVHIEGHTLCLTPINPLPTLDEILDRITPENIHPEIDFGPARGNEVW